MRRSLPHSLLKQKTLPSWALPTRSLKKALKPRLKRRKIPLRLRQLLLLLNLQPLLTINEMINLDSSISSQPLVRQE